VTRQVIFRPQADQEVQSARLWFEEQRPGLGIEFAHSTDETIERISSNALAFPVVHGDTRRAVVRRFPYGIYFRVLQSRSKCHEIRVARRSAISTREGRMRYFL
jgi:hypothetical protein